MADAIVLDLFDLATKWRHAAAMLEPAGVPPYTKEELDEADELIGKCVELCRYLHLSPSEPDTLLRFARSSNARLIHLSYNGDRWLRLRA